MKERNMKRTYTIKIKTILIVTIHLLLMLVISPGLQAETYDLKAFLSRVESHSKDLKLAMKELEMAKVYKKEALSSALPKIMMEANYNRNLKANYLYIDFPDFETGEMTNQKFKIN